MRYICLSLYPNLTFLTLCSVLRALFSVCGTHPYALVCTYSTYGATSFHRTDIGSSQNGGGLALSPRTGVPYPAIMGAHGANAYLSASQMEEKPTAERAAVALTATGYRRTVARLCAC